MRLLCLGTGVDYFNLLKCPQLIVVIVIIYYNNYNNYYYYEDGDDDDDNNNNNNNSKITNHWRAMAVASLLTSDNEVQRVTVTIDRYCK